MSKKINWTNWQQLRGVQVWEACLLSVNADPSTILHEFKIGFYSPSLVSPQVFNASFPGNNVHNEYHRRLRLVTGYLELADTFSLLSQAGSNQNLWEIHLSEFSAWAKRLDLEIPL